MSGGSPTGAKGSPATAAATTTTLDLFDTGEQSDDSLVLEGQMSAPGSSGHGPGKSAAGPGMNTLDEPIEETIMRDVKAVKAKFLQVLNPKENKSLLLKDWDLWGPLILCTVMATILQSSDDHDGGGGPGFEDGSGPGFAEVFVIVWVGAMVVTLNTKLLGGHISFFQSVCVLGYCLLPLCLALIVCYIGLSVVSQGPIASTVLFAVRLASALIGFAWAVFAASRFLGDCQPPKRKALAAYPMGLFYFVVAWLVASYS